MRAGRAIRDQALVRRLGSTPAAIAERAGRPSFEDRVAEIDEEKLALRAAGLDETSALLTIIRGKEVTA